MTGLLTILPKPITGLFIFYLVCKGADFFLGILKTWKNKHTWKSEKMRNGIVKWIAELIAIVLVIIVDIILGTNYVLILATLGLFIYREWGSVAENLGECGVDLPDIIGDRLEIFNPNNKINQKQD